MLVVLATSSFQYLCYQMLTWNIQKYARLFGVLVLGCKQKPQPLYNQTKYLRGPVHIHERKMMAPLFSPSVFGRIQNGTLTDIEVLTVSHMWCVQAVPLGPLWRVNSGLSAEGVDLGLCMKQFSRVSGQRKVSLQILYTIVLATWRHGSWLLKFMSK